MAIPIDPRDKARLVKEGGCNLDNWNVILQHNRSSNVTGEVPQLKAKLGGQLTNKELAAKWGVSTRQASKIRNHKIPIPTKVLKEQRSVE